MNKVGSWQPVIDAFERRLSLWKARHLSIGGRITLIKSVLNSLPLYFFSLYKAPVAVTDKLERIRKAFFWGGTEDRATIHWIAWDKVIKPKHLGGMGIGSLKDTNLCLLSKWWWRFKTEPLSLWGRVVGAIHNVLQVGGIVPKKPRYVGVWNNIAKLDVSFKSLGINLNVLFSGIAGNGQMLAFWTDLWLGELPFCFKFPALFRLETHKGCKINERVGSSGGVIALNWSWTRNLDRNREIDELFECESLLQHVVLNASNDRWRWHGDKSGTFSVKALKSRIHEVSLRCDQEFVMLWSKYVPIKANVLAWRADLGRLPTKDGLKKRYVNVGSGLCQLCENEEESVEHLFIGCEMAAEL